MIEHILKIISPLAVYFNCCPVNEHSRRSRYFPISPLLYLLHLGCGMLVDPSTSCVTGFVTTTSNS